MFADGKLSVYTDNWSAICVCASVRARVSFLQNVSVKKCLCFVFVVALGWHGACNQRTPCATHVGVWLWRKGDRLGDEATAKHRLGGRFIPNGQSEKGGVGYHRRFRLVRLIHYAWKCRDSSRLLHGTEGSWSPSAVARACNRCRL